jgi:hypothetical protein
MDTALYRAENEQSARMSNLHCHRFLDNLRSIFGVFFFFFFPFFVFSPFFYPRTFFHCFSHCQKIGSGRLWVRTLIESLLILSLFLHGIRHRSPTTRHLVRYGCLVTNGVLDLTAFPCGQAAVRKGTSTSTSAHPQILRVSTHEPFPKVKVRTHSRLFSSFLSLSLSAIGSFLLTLTSPDTSHS